LFCNPVDADCVGAGCCTLAGHSAAGEAGWGQGARHHAGKHLLLLAAAEAANASCKSFHMFIGLSFTLQRLLPNPSSIVTTFNN
jgi:hypothetical protein